LFVVVVDGRELVAKIFLDDRFHVLGQVAQADVDVLRIGPDAPADKSFVVVGEVHEAGEILPEADGVDDREPHASRRKRGEQPQHDGLDRAHRFLPAGAVGLDEQRRLTRDGESRREFERRWQFQLEAAALRVFIRDLFQIDGEFAKADRRAELFRRRPVLPVRIVPVRGLGGFIGARDRRLNLR
jgi:hypothetical protein